MPVHRGGTILGQLADLAVDLNGVLVPGRSIEGALAHHAHPLVINNNEDDTYKVWLRGSATPVRYRDRELLLTTQHQLQGVDESQVAMLIGNGRDLVTTAGRAGYSLHPDSDAHDIIAFDFTEPCRDIPELRGRFFNLARRPPDVRSDHIVGFLLYGYPFKDQNYDLAENNHLGLRRRYITCTLHSQSADPALMTIRPVQPLTFDPDGMSGGSAFVIQIEDEQPSAYFAGIIVRAGTTLLHILKVGFVIEFLDSLDRQKVGRPSSAGPASAS
jgi:hypothetical protein